MVDDSLFSKEGTVARSSQDIVRFFYLQRLEDVLRSQKDFYSTNRNSGAFIRVRLEWKASLFSLLSLCRPRLEMKDKAGYKFSYGLLRGLVDSGVDDDLVKATGLLIEYLEVDLKITDISKVQDYDRTNIILSNKMKGYK